MKKIVPHLDWYFLVTDDTLKVGDDFISDSVGYYKVIWYYSPFNNKDYPWSMSTINDEFMLELMLISMKK